MVRVPASQAQATQLHKRKYLILQAKSVNDNTILHDKIATNMGGRGITYRSSQKSKAKSIALKG